MELYELGAGGYRPVRAPRAAEAAAGTEQKKASAGGAQQLRDVASLTRKAQPGRTVSAETVLGRLHEMGVLESASRPLPMDPETLEDPVAELTIRLSGETGAEGEAAEQPETADTLESAEEWRPYQPPAAAPQSAQLVSEDGSVKLTLFAMPDGTAKAMMELDGILLPMDEEGALLAQLLDGSFRMLTMDGDALLAMLDAGLAALSLPEDGRSEAPPPAPAQAETVPLTGQDASPEAETETADRARFAPPEPQGKTPRPPLPGQAFTALRTALSPETEAWTQKLSPLPRQKPGGAAEWATERAAARSYQQVTENWLRETPDPAKPEAMARLQAMRQNWAASLQRENPPAFRAWLGLQSGGEGEAAQTGVEALPHELAPRDNASRMSGDTLSYANEAKSAGDGGAAFLRSVLSAARPPEGGATVEETAALLKSAFFSEDGAWRKQDEDGALTRRVSDYLSQLLSGDARANTRAHAETLDLPQQPRRGEDELEKAWKRRQIAWEVDSAWTGNLKEWLLHVDGWNISRSQDYVNGKANEWTTGLMRGQPAQFRQWLGSPVRYAASTGWFNGATDSFPINTLPEGFTDEDLRRWLRWDVLDYL